MPHGGSGSEHNRGLAIGEEGRKLGPEQTGLFVEKDKAGELGLRWPIGLG